MRLEELIKKIEGGWSPPPLPPAEDLRRVRLLIQGCIAKMLDCCPEEEREIARQIERPIDDLKPLIDRISSRVEERYPGLIAACEKMVEREKKLAAEVA